MQKKILYIDLDGVVADFDKHIRTVYPAFDRDFIDEQSRHDKVDEIAGNDPHLFQFLHFIKDAKKSVLVLTKYYDVYFLSTPMWKIPESYAGKRIWIRNNFGEYFDKRLILTHRKDLCIGDYLIDDKKVNGAGEFKGMHIHFGVGQFQDWLEVENYLVLQYYKNHHTNVATA
jgi:5'(3')-deoxyribonucleotidase